MDDNFPIPVIFAKAVDLGIALGWKSIKDLPGCQEHQIDEQWWFAINPHDKPEKCSAGTKVPSYSIYFEFNGWPAGFCNAVNGTLAHGSVANENALIKALDAAIEKLESA
jgi:hypothetical protein